MSRQLKVKVRGSEVQIKSFSEKLREFYEVVPTSQILQSYGDSDAHQFLTLVEVDK